MKIVLQRVSSASVSVEKNIIANINSGMLIFVGIVEADSDADIKWLANKIVNLRIFSDNNGVMNNSILQSEGEIIVVSQFTLHANTKKGHRPSYNLAATPEVAVPIYKKFLKKLELDLGKPIESGQFGADMQISLVNDGPVTIIIDSKNEG